MSCQFNFMVILKAGVSTVLCCTNICRSTLLIFSVGLLIIKQYNSTAPQMKASEIKKFNQHSSAQFQQKTERYSLQDLFLQGCSFRLH